MFAFTCVLYTSPTKSIVSIPMSSLIRVIVYALIAEVVSVPEATFVASGVTAVIVTVYAPVPASFIALAKL